jgi:hypothetical protein
VSLKPTLFLETIIAFLLPYFTIGTADPSHARTEILETLASFATRTRSEMLQAARIVAFGMTTLDVLAEARTAGMSISMRVRFHGSANGLNRSALQTEKSLGHRLACDPLTVPEPMPDPGSPDPDPEIPVAVNCPSGARPAIGTKPDEWNRQLWAGAMMHVVKQMGIPLAPDG